MGITLQPFLRIGIQKKIMGSITWIEWGIWLVFFVFIFVLLYTYRHFKEDAAYRFFLGAFVLKVLGGVAFAFVYVYYYKFGDTFLYFRGGQTLAQTLVDSPGDYFRLLMADNGNLPADLGDFEAAISYSRGAEEWFMVKLLSPLVLLAFDSYLVVTLLMSLISFFGAWKLFLVLKDLLPNRQGMAFFAAFLIPSALFWCGGIMKDTFTLAGINYVIYCLYFLVFKGQFSWWRWIAVILVSMVVFYLKGYIIIAFIPSLLFGINAVLNRKFDTKILRYVFGILFFGFTAVIVYFGPTFLAETSSKYALSSVEGRVKGFHTWHTDVGGAIYSLGEIEYTAVGVVEKIPSALNVTFFRPYLWESANPMVLIAAVESSLVLILFIYLLFKLRFRIFWLIHEQPILITFVVYCLIFGFIVGFTSYNFGALGRYKIPIYSLFIFVLLYLYTKVKTPQSYSPNTAKGKGV